MNDRIRLVVFAVISLLGPTKTTLSKKKPFNHTIFSFFTKEKEYIFGTLHTTTTIAINPCLREKQLLTVSSVGVKISSKESILRFHLQYRSEVSLNTSEIEKDELSGIRFQQCWVGHGKGRADPRQNKTRGVCDLR